MGLHGRLTGFSSVLTLVLLSLVPVLLKLRLVLLNLVPVLLNYDLNIDLRMTSHMPHPYTRLGPECA